MNQTQFKRYKELILNRKEESNSMENINYMYIKRLKGNGFCIELCVHSVSLRNSLLYLLYQCCRLVSNMCEQIVCILYNINGWLFVDYSLINVQFTIYAILTYKVVSCVVNSS